MKTSGTMNSATGHTSVSTRTGNFNDGLYDRAGARPDLDLDFARTKSLKDRVSKEELITFTRSTGVGKGATYVDENGLVKVAPINAVVNSEDLSNATYAFSGNDKGVLSANAGTSPDGGLADALVGQGLTGRHTVGVRPAAVNNSYLLANNTQYVMSVFVKRLSGNIADRYVNLETAQYSTWSHTGTSGIFDLETGTRITNPTGTGAANITSGIEDVGDGWYRIHFSTTTGTVTNATGFYVNVVRDTGGTGGVTLTSSQGILVWGAQTEYGSVPTTYIPTNGLPSGAPRFTHDPVTKESKGLLIEQQSINYVQKSTTFSNWNSSGIDTKNIDTSITAPDGTAGAVKVVASSSTGVHYISAQAVVGPANTTKIRHSVFLKYGNYRFVDIYGGYNNWMTNNTGVRVDLLNGTASTVGTSTSLTAVEEVKQFPNGWIKVTVKADHASGVTPNAQPFYLWFVSETGNTTMSMSGINGSYFYAWGAQTETGSDVATSTIINETTGSVTRSPDLASIEGDNFGTYRTNVVTNTSFRKGSDGYLLTGGNANATYESYAGISPSGNYDALKMTATSATGTHRILQYVTLDDSSVYSVSAYVKAGSSDKCIVNLWDGNSNVGMVRVDLTAETAVNIGGVNNTNVNMTDVGNGWYLIQLTSITTTVSGLPAIIVSILNDTLAGTYAGNGESLFVWGMQAVKANTPSEFIPSTDTYTNRQSNATFVDGNGIIRTSYANDIQNSEAFNDTNYWKTAVGNPVTFTLNNKVAPDGTLTAHTPSQHMPMWGALYWKSNNNTGWAITVGSANFNITTEWQRFSYTFLMPDNARTGQSNFRIYPLRNAEGGAYYIYSDPALTLVPDETYTYSAWYKLIDGVNHVWGVQINKGSEAGDYYKTTGTISGPPRYSHDPETLTPTGLYLEAKTVNNARDTERLGATTSSADTSDVYIAGPYTYSHSKRKTETGITNPDGSTDGTTVVTVSSGTFNRQQPRGFRLANINSLVGRQVQSVFVKRKTSTARYVVLFMGGTGTYQQCLFDFDTETVVENTAPHNLAEHQQYNSADYLVERGVVKYPNGWYRLYMIVDTGSSVIAGNGYGVGLAQDPITSKSGNATDDGPYDGTEAIYVWGLNRCSAEDLDSSNVPQETHLSSYIKNSTVAASEVTRTPDTFTSTATEVLDRANGTKPAFFTKDGTSFFVRTKLNNQRIAPIASNALNNTHIYNPVINLSQSSTSIVSLFPDNYASWTTPPSPRMIAFTGAPTNIYLGQSYTEGEEIESAIRFQENNSRFALNTTISNVDTSVTMGSPTILNIGQTPISSRILNGTINRLTFWKTPLPDNKLDSITS